MSLNVLAENCPRYYSRKRISSKDSPIFIGMFIFKIPMSSKVFFSWPDPRDGGWEVCSRAGSAGLSALEWSGVSKSLSCWPLLPRVFPFWFGKLVTESSVFTDILEQLSLSLPSADKPPRKQTLTVSSRFSVFSLKPVHGCCKVSWRTFGVLRPEGRQSRERVVVSDPPPSPPRAPIFPH